MKLLINVFIATLILATTSVHALENDAKDRRVTVKRGEIHKGGAPEPYNAILVKDVGNVGTTPLTIATALARISDVGADTLAFNLDGLSPDGTSIAPAGLEAVQALKNESQYRWTKIMCRVFGNVNSKDQAVRLTAVQTAAQALQGSTSILYWIDGPQSADLVAAFKKIAPKLTVVAPHGGDVDAVLDEYSIKDGRPAMVIGKIPCIRNAHVNSLVIDEGNNLVAYDAANAETIESQAWTPTTEGLTQAEIDEGFYTLFYRNDMSNWTVTGDKKDGFIEHRGGISWNGKGGRRVQSRKRYDNFVLRLEWKLQRHHGNSGVFIRAPRVNRESALGMEIQVFGDPGEQPNKNSSGSIYDVLPATSNPTNPVGEWNTYEIYANGDHIRVTINGVIVQDVNIQDHEKLIPRLKKGFIKLQDHNDQVTFRHIRIKEL